MKNLIIVMEELNFYKKKFLLHLFCLHLDVGTLWRSTARECKGGNMHKLKITKPFSTKI